MGGIIPAGRELLQGSMKLGSQAGFYNIGYKAFDLSWQKREARPGEGLKIKFYNNII